MVIHVRDLILLQYYFLSGDMVRLFIKDLRKSEHVIASVGVIFLTAACGDASTRHELQSGGGSQLEAKSSVGADTKYVLQPGEVYWLTKAADMEGVDPAACELFKDEVFIAEPNGTLVGFFGAHGPHATDEQRYGFPYLGALKDGNVGLNGGSAKYEVQGPYLKLIGTPYWIAPAECDGADEAKALYQDLSNYDPGAGVSRQEIVKAHFPDYREPY